MAVLLNHKCWTALEDRPAGENSEEESKACKDGCGNNAQTVQLPEVKHDVAGSVAAGGARIRSRSSGAAATSRSRGSSSTTTEASVDSRAGYRRSCVASGFGR